MWVEGRVRPSRMAGWAKKQKNKKAKRKKKNKPCMLFFKLVASSTVASAPESQETSKNKQVFQILIL